MVRVGIVDNHPITLWGLRSVLEADHGITVVAACPQPNEIDPSTLDVLLLDAYLGTDLPCIALVARMSARTAIIMISSFNRIDDMNECISAGARAYLHTASPVELFGETVRRVAAGDAPPAAPSFLSGDQSLSPRERAVLNQIAWGLTHDQIARRLGISKHTVDTYVKRVRAKLKLGNKAELTRAALKSIAS